MFRKLTATTLIGALIGALALGMVERRQAPADSTAQLPPGLALGSANLRDLFP